MSEAVFTPDGRRAVTAAFQQGMTVWDAGSGELILESPINESGSRIVVWIADRSGSADRWRIVVSPGDVVHCQLDIPRIGPISGLGTTF